MPQTRTVETVRVWGTLVPTTDHCDIISKKWCRHPDFKPCRKNVYDVRKFGLICFGPYSLKLHIPLQFKQGVAQGICGNRQKDATNNIGKENTY